MNLEKLFKLQKELDEHIEKKHPRKEGEDRLSKKILALQVELAECAQESRCFKYWSNDQEPRTWKRVNCPACEKKGFVRGNPPVDPIKGKHGLGNHWYDCDDCAGFLVVDKNPLLEEYVDCLHFILSIGLELELDCRHNSLIREENIVAKEPTLYLFAEVISFASELFWECHQEDYEQQEGTFKVLFTNFVELGKSLNFTWNQVEEAYYAKNKINHERQESGY